MTRAISATLAALTAVGLFALTAKESHLMSKEPRFPQLTMEQLTEAQKPLAGLDNESLKRRPGRSL
jgi:hypothetical protein